MKHIEIAVTRRLEAAATQLFLVEVVGDGTGKYSSIRYAVKSESASEAKQACKTAAAKVKHKGKASIVDSGEGAVKTAKRSKVKVDSLKKDTPVEIAL